MYLNNLYIQNIGSIERVVLNENDLITSDDPKIIIFAGLNGSGKTTLLSTIIDSFYELSNKIFEDSLPSKGFGYQYFKVLGGTILRMDSSYGYSYLSFISNDSKKYEYIEKIGDLSFSDCKKKTDDKLTLSEGWNDNCKITSEVKSDEELKSDFLTNTYCYFPSDRFEYPFWINIETINKKESFIDKMKFSNRLNKDFLIRQSLLEIKQWILDIYLDSRADIFENSTDNGTVFSIENNIPDFINLKKSRHNIELLISEIVEEDVELSVNYRRIGQSRLKLINKNTKLDYLHSLDALSAGQSTLLSIFCNIIKQSDDYNISKSFNLEQISGIVLIDEIELHLHINIQKNILPKLIKLFPKIQFIITTHSPFFLYGMNQYFNDEKCIILNMPNGNKIEFDDFTEFDNAFDIFDNLTKTYKSELLYLKSYQSNNDDKALIVTEGKTDWKNLKNALLKFQNNGLYKELDIEFLEYEDEIEMGDSALKIMYESYSKIPSNKRIIFLFDRDNPKLEYIKKENFISNIENIYAMCIPKINNNLDDISIEHYYTDNDLKTLDKNKRRLFFGNEFYNNGNSKCGFYQTTQKNKCGKKTIIDAQVFFSSDLKHENSIALSKNDFSECILYNKQNFENINIDNFKLIFDVFKDILGK
jgi:hypothetical protein